MKFMIVFTLCMVSVACVYAATANCPEISRLSNQILGLQRQLFRRMQKTTKLLQSAVFQTKCNEKKCYMTDYTGQLPPRPEKLCCPNGWELIKGTCFLIFTKPSSWFQAQINCHTLKATLIMPDTLEKVKWLSYIVKKYKKSFWMDITDLGTEGKYRFFSTGKGVRYTNYYHNEPSGGVQDCFMAHIPHGGQWHDVSCDTYSSYGSICERAADTC